MADFGLVIDLKNTKKNCIDNHDSVAKFISLVVQKKISRLSNRQFF